MEEEKVHEMLSKLSSEHDPTFVHRIIDQIRNELPMLHNFTEEQRKRLFDLINSLDDRLGS